MNTCKNEINEFRLTGKDYYAFSCYLIYPWYRNSNDEIFIWLTYSRATGGGKCMEGCIDAK